MKRDEPMSRHTSWHVGGPADVYFSPRDRADLLEFLATLPAGTPLFWLGLGSNLLVRDGGIRGVVIDTQSGLTRLERINDTTLTCEAGVPCARLARQCIKWGLAPAEFLAGIPGTLGGALAMNAGAFGGETWPRVRSVDVCDARGIDRRRDAREYSYGYRHIVPPAPGEFFLAASLEFEYRPGTHRRSDARAARASARKRSPSANGAAARLSPIPRAITPRVSSKRPASRAFASETSWFHPNTRTSSSTSRPRPPPTSRSSSRTSRPSCSEKFGVALTPEFRIAGETL